MKRVKKILVWVFGVISIASMFNAMCCVENLDRNGKMLFGSLIVAVLSYFIGSAINHPKDYYRHVLGASAVIYAVLYDQFDKGGKVGKDMDNLRDQLHSYPRLYEYISDRFYYGDDIKLEDYVK